MERHLGFNAVDLVEAGERICQRRLTDGLAALEDHLASVVKRKIEGKEPDPRKRQRLLVAQEDSVRLRSQELRARGLARLRTDLKTFGYMCGDAILEERAFKEAQSTLVLFTGNDDGEGSEGKGGEGETQEEDEGDENARSVEAELDAKLMRLVYRAEELRSELKSLQKRRARFDKAIPAAETVAKEVRAALKEFDQEGYARVTELAGQLARVSQSLNALSDHSLARLEGSASSSSSSLEANFAKVRSATEGTTKEMKAMAERFE